MKWMTAVRVKERILRVSMKTLSGKTGPGFVVGCRSTARMVLAVILAIGILAGGCAMGPASVLDPEKPSTDSMPETVKAESEALKKKQREYRDGLERVEPKKIDIEPVMPKYDPLDNKMVSFSMVDEDMRTVLYVLSQAVGMNLIIDPAIQPENNLITLHFERVPASKVLKHILKTFDLYYEADDNVIAIRPFADRIFHLNFLDAKLSTAFDVGGDVFGAGDTETASGLTGNFKLTGEGSKQGNPYDVLETTVKPMLSSQGKMSLNRLAGTLYIKDTPGNIAAIERMVEKFKEMLSRQIRIEAQIIEVALSDEHRYGINWSLLKDDPGTGNQVSSASWSLGEGLIIEGVRGAYSLSGLINALNRFGDTRVISNPSIRCKHGKPSIISVGTSYTYKKSVTTTTTGTGDSTRDSVEVEVSTVFDGLIFGVVPFIQHDNRITLLLNPIKSEVDPASLEPESIGTSAAESISLPEISIKEITTTIAINSGDTIILGGLIDKREVVDNRGIPFLSSIPILGYLFKNEYRREETRELVLILSVSIV